LDLALPFAIWRGLAGGVDWGHFVKKATKNLRPQTRLSLETGAVLDGALSRYLRRGWWCLSVMSVLEKCDEEVGQYAVLFVRTIIGAEAKRSRKLRGENGIQNSE
jgi:hypothetical protein